MDDLPEPWVDPYSLPLEPSPMIRENPTPVWLGCLLSALCGFSSVELLRWLCDRTFW